MKHFIIINLLLFFSLCIKAQNTASIVIGKKDVIQSNILKENRTLWIYVPNITAHLADTTKRYPVLYVLDGEAQFYSTVGMIQQLSQANGNGVLPEMIVVGIENTNRLRDLVPSGDAFKPNPLIDFLKSELIPYVEANYKTAPYRTIVGHSLGGLMTVDILTHYPDLFNAYLAIDPSMWYKNETILTNTLNHIHKQNLTGKRLFIGIANTMPKGMKMTQLAKDKTVTTQHIRSILKLDGHLKKNQNGLRYSSKYYEKEKHNTVPLISLYDGLQHLFDYYPLDADEKDFADSTTAIAQKLSVHYKNVSAMMGYQNAAPEALMNYLAYEASTKKQYPKAKALYQLNMEWYPQSSNVYAAYADFLLSQKDTTGAIMLYEKALKIKDTPNIQTKLKQLTNKHADNENSLDLQRYAGIYILEKFNLPIVLEMRDKKLFAKVPGQTDDEFIPISKDVFTVKGKQGYTITFKMNGDKPVEFTSVQPNGTFKAVFKNE